VKGIWQRVGDKVSRFRRWDQGGKARGLVLMGSWFSVNGLVVHSRCNFE
jgi:hypothetical protein